MQVFAVNPVLIFKWQRGANSQLKT